RHRLADAAAPHDADGFAALDLESDVLKNLQITEALGHLAELEEGGGSGIRHVNPAAADRRTSPPWRDLHSTRGGPLPANRARSPHGRWRRRTHRHWLRG